MRQRRRQHFHVMRTKQRPHLLDSRSVRAITVTDKQSFGIEPDHVTGFSFSRRLNLSQRWDANAATEFDVPLRLRNPIQLARMEANEAVVGRERRIMCVDGIQRKVGSSWQMEHFGAGGLKLAAKFVMLRLRDREIRRMNRSPAPANGRRWMAGPNPPRAASTPVLGPGVRPWNGR